jgi:hypothetical protein
MSTGPGPTRKDDGSPDASVDDIAELLVEDEGHKGSVTEEHVSDDGLDVMLETPGPVLATTFLPPPPAPAGLAGEESEGLEEAGAPTNLAYEDLLAKLVLPAKAPEPEPTMPEPALPPPEAVDAPVAALLHEPVLPSITRPSSPSLQVAPPTEERTLVTDNPLVAEEQQAAAREGRASMAYEQPPVVGAELRPAATERLAPLINGAAKSKLVYLMLGALLMLGMMVFAVLLLKLLMPTPAPQPPVVTAPPPVPQPPPTPPAQVQPLPPTPAPPVAAPPPAQANPEAAKAAEPAPEEVRPTPEPEKPRPHRREGRAKPSRPAAPKAAPAAKTSSAVKAAPAPAAKPAKGSKKSKASSYVDPFDN